MVRLRVATVLSIVIAFLANCLVLPTTYVPTLVAAAPPQKIAYTATVDQLGALPGDSWSVANDLNNAGTIVGTSVGNIPRAFIYRGQQMSSIPGLGSTSSSAYGLNEAGQVVGAMALRVQLGHTYGFQTHAFLYSSNTVIDLTNRIPGVFDNDNAHGFSIAYGVNSTGRVVGTANFPPGYGRSGVLAFQFSNGTMQSLPPLQGAERSVATGINDNGLIVGCARFFHGPGRWSYRAFLYQNGQTTDLHPLLPGYSSSCAYAVNNSGQVVVTADKGTTRRIFVYQSQRMTDTTITQSPIPSQEAYLFEGEFRSYHTQYGINRDGKVVAGTPTFYEKGTATDLSSFTTTSGAQLSEMFHPNLVNDRDQLIAWGNIRVTSNEAPAILFMKESAPRTVVVLVMGLASSIASAGQFSPLSFDYSTLSNCSSSCPAGLKEVASYFNTDTPTKPNSSERVPSFTDHIAATGAIIVPFSYNGSLLGTDTRGRPVFRSNAYGDLVPGYTLPDAASRMLDSQIRSIHTIWPRTRIVVVGHSQGGLVAETYSRKYSASASGVVAVFSLDSPLNGVQNTAACFSGGATLGLCTLAGPLLGKISLALGAQYFLLWAKNSVMPPTRSNLLTAVGTRGDLLYSVANAPVPGIASQLAFSGVGYCCVQTPPSFVAPRPYPPGFGWDPRTWVNTLKKSHMWVLHNPSVIDRVVSAIQGQGTGGSWLIAATDAALPQDAAGPEAHADTTVATPNQTITILGSGLGPTPGQIAFTSADGQPCFATIVSWSDTAITLVVPANAATGPITLVTADDTPVFSGGITITGADNGVAALQVQVGPAAIQGQPTTITAIARNQWGQAVPNIAISLSNGLGQITQQSDQAGATTFTVPGFGTVTFDIVSGNTRVPATVTWQDPPPMILRLTSPATQLALGQSIVVTAEVVDGNGQSIANQAVDFTLNGPQSATLSMTQVTTDSQGLAQVLASNTADGDVVVTASTNNGSTTDTLGLSWYSPTYAITLTAGTGGMVAADPISGPYPANADLTLSAAPDAGYTFSSWTIDGTAAGTTNPLTMKMDRDYIVVATFAAIPQAELSVVANGGGVARSPDGGMAGNGAGTYTYQPGQPVILAPIPNDGWTFIRWTINGTDRGWSSPLTLIMNGTHTVHATFAPTRAFPDVPDNRPDYTAITALATRNTIRGYQNGNYGPDDKVTRSQMAALIARATSSERPPGHTLSPPNCLVEGTWDCENWGNTFVDQSGDPNLWRNVGTLQHYGVASGYDGVHFGPNDQVTYAQTIAFITRMMVTKGYWQWQPNAPLPYAGVPQGHLTDVRTFYYYTQAYGGVPAAPTSEAGWSSGATRGWFAMALWAALDSYFGH
jgi:probable HAF family extracellular repeat protein